MDAVLCTRYTCDEGISKGINSSTTHTHLPWHKRDTGKPPNPEEVGTCLAINWPGTHSKRVTMYEMTASTRRFLTTRCVETLYLTVPSYSNDTRLFLVAVFRSQTAAFCAGTTYGQSDNKR